MKDARAEQTAAVGSAAPVMQMSNAPQIQAVDVLLRHAPMHAVPRAMSATHQLAALRVAPAGNAARMAAGEFVGAAEKMPRARGQSADATTMPVATFVVRKMIRAPWDPAARPLAPVGNAVLMDVAECAEPAMQGYPVRLPASVPPGKEAIPTPTAT